MVVHGCGWLVMLSIARIPKLLITFLTCCINELLLYYFSRFFLFLYLLIRIVFPLPLCIERVPVWETRWQSECIDRYRAWTDVGRHWFSSLTAESGPRHSPSVHWHHVSVHRYVHICIQLHLTSRAYSHFSNGEFYTFFPCAYKQSF